MKRTALMFVLVLLVIGAPVSARSTYREGTGVIRFLDGGYDLDAGTPRSPARATADIWRDRACVDPGSALAADGCHTVLLEVFGQSGMTGKLGARPSYRTCRDQTYEGGAQDTDGNGAWYCVRTSAGRYARLRVTHWPEPGARRLRFAYRVWV